MNLDAVRRELGDRWERQAEKFYEASEKVPRARLSAEDVFTRNNNGQFIICFAELSEGDAWFKAQAIQKEIQDKLIGERVDPLLAHVRVEAHAIQISPEEREADDIAGLIARKLAREAELLKREADRLLSEILRTGGLAPRPVLDARGNETELLICEFDRETQAKLDRIAVAHENDPKIIAEIDALLLGRAAEHARDAAPRAPDRSLVVRLHFSTIYNRQPREKYLGICRQLPAPVRKALGFVVHGIPEDILPVRVTELLGILRPFAPMRLVHWNASRSETSVCATRTSRWSRSMPAACGRRPWTVRPSKSSGDSCAATDAGSWWTGYRRPATPSSPGPSERSSWPTIVRRAPPSPRSPLLPADQSRVGRRRAGRRRAGRREVLAPAGAAIPAPLSGGRGPLSPPA